MEDWKHPVWKTCVYCDQSVWTTESDDIKVDCGLCRNQIPRSEPDQWQTIRNKALPFLLERDNGECQNCGSTENITVDHKTPRSKGGGHEIGNLQLLCRACNCSKGVKT